jgi:hypothetical protein
MSVQTPGGTADERVARAPAAYDYDMDARRGDGWVTFAGIMLMIAGTMNFIGGIAAIDNANFYVNDARFIFSDLNTWGWVITILGSVQFLVALGIWARNGFSRWLGVLFAAGNAVAQLLMLPAYPLWSLAIFTLDILIVYGLVVYGGRLEERA